MTEQGRPSTVWRRTPAGGTVELDLVSGDDAPLVVDSAQEQVVLRVTVRVRDKARVVDLALVNDQGMRPGSPDLARTYQTGLTVTALDGASAVFLGHNDPEFSKPPTADDPERLHLALLYRNMREFAHGRQCAVDADVRDGEVRAWQLRTTSFPAADVPLTVAGSTKAMPGLILDMARLGSPELARDDLVRALRPLATGYRAWLTRQRGRLEEPEVRNYEPAGSHALALAFGLADRLDRAVDLLRDDGVAREAFRFSNQAMALQRVRSEVTRARLASPTTPLEELLQRFDVPGQRSWRPFQRPGRCRPWVRHG